MKTNLVDSLHPDDSVRSMKDAGVRERRKAMLEAPHIAPLTAYVNELRSRPDVQVPYFDPLDGGVNAEILFLLEKPGPMTAESPLNANGGSGFISRNNNDGTAQNMWTFMKEIDTPRRQTVTWNVVPWWNGTMKITASELKEGVACVEDLVKRLPRLKVIVLVGGQAQRAKPLLEKSGLKIIDSYHPSSRVRALYPDKWKAIPGKWREAKDFIDAFKAIS